MSSETRQCQNCKQSFRIEPEDFTFYEKIKVPPPTWCPECRLIRRLSFRNERFLYKNRCGLCQKEVISNISPDEPYTVYCQPDWWSDKWDPLSHGQAYDFSQPFFVQFANLIRRIPWSALNNTYTTLVNSEYVNMSGYQKNCYLTSHADHNEDCAYGSGLNFSRECMDITWVQNSELCTQCFNVLNGYRNVFSVNCDSCHNVYFSKNLTGCHDCIGCVNLRGKSHYIFNHPYSREEYMKKFSEFDFGSYREILALWEQSQQFWIQFPNRFYQGSHNENVTGNYIYHSKNVFFSHEMFGAEDCKYCQFLSTKPSKNCYDYTEWGQGTSLIYEALVVGENADRVQFCNTVVANTHHVQYSMQCFNSEYVFGCVGLRHKQYCILNRQYSKEEYGVLLPKIIEQMNQMPYVDRRNRIHRYGEFFPSDLSLFCYNETAQEYFPLTQDQATAQGYRWRDPEPRTYEITKQPEDLPDHIQDVEDSILQEIIGCAHHGACPEQCTTAFKIIPQELEFYRKLHLPLPRLCPNCRHYQRLRQRNPLKLWHRQCTCSGEKSSNGVYPNQSPHPSHARNHPCPNEFETSYAPERPEIVYCEPCYQAEVV